MLRNQHLGYRFALYTLYITIKKLNTYDISEKICLTSKLKEYNTKKLNELDKSIFIK